MWIHVTVIVCVNLVPIKQDGDLLSEHVHACACVCKPDFTSKTVQKFHGLK
jgi:hypothetical protein